MAVMARVERQYSGVKPWVQNGEEALAPLSSLCTPVHPHLQNWSGKVAWAAQESLSGLPTKTACPVVGRWGRLSHHPDSR